MDRTNWITLPDGFSYSVHSTDPVGAHEIRRTLADYFRHG